MSETKYIGEVLGLANQIKRVFDTTTDRCGAQVRILNYVLSCPDKEIYQKDIVEELHIRDASVSALLKKMEANNMIRRERVASDDRLKKILPTDQIMAIKEQVLCHISLLENCLTDGITSEELEVFSGVVQKMQKNMELTERRESASFINNNKKVRLK